MACMLTEPGAKNAGADDAVLNNVVVECGAKSSGGCCPNMNWRGMGSKAEGQVFLWGSMLMSTGL